MQIIQIIFKYKYHLQINACIALPGSLPRLDRTLCCTTWTPRYLPNTDFPRTPDEDCRTAASESEPRSRRFSSNRPTWPTGSILRSWGCALGRPCSSSAFPSTRSSRWRTRGPSRTRCRPWVGPSWSCRCRDFAGGCTTDECKDHLTRILVKFIIKTISDY